MIYQLSLFYCKSDIFNQAFYPLFTSKAKDKYNKYKLKLKSISKVITVCGRLGTYRYFIYNRSCINMTLNVMARNFISKV